MDNITVRKKITSCDNLSCISDDFNDESFLSPNHQQNSTIKSLPNIYTVNEEIDELNKHIRQLTSQLDSAHVEIENLSLENSELKNQLSICMEKLNLYKKIGVSENVCKTPKNQVKVTHTSQKKRSSKSKQKRKNLIQSKINIKNPDEPCCSKTLHYDNEKITNCKPSTISSQNNKKKIISNYSNTLKNHTVKTPSVMGLKPKHKVLIFCDYRGIRLQNILQQLLGPLYEVLCFSKPGAIMENIISTLPDEVKKLTEQDYIILIGGSYDKNPYELSTNLDNFFKATTHTNILVCQVFFNRYLNEGKLNYEVKFLCSKNEYTTYIDMGYDYEKYTKTDYFNNICQRVLKEILHIKYKLDYKGYVQQQIKINKTKSTIAEKNKITYYFKNNIQSQERNLKQIKEQNNDFFRV